MRIDTAARLYWDASRILLNPATPPHAADNAGMALVALWTKCPHPDVARMAGRALTLAGKSGRLDFAIEA